VAVAKNEAFAPNLVELAEFARALSHPARIEILRILARKDTCQCGEVVDRLPVAQSTVSQHLKILKEVGLIEGEIDGPRICYCLNHKRLKKAEKAFGRLFSEAGNVK